MIGRGLRCVKLEPARRDPVLAGNGALMAVLPLRPSRYNPDIGIAWKWRRV